jgi:hypothetical protein
MAATTPIDALTKARKAKPRTRRKSRIHHLLATNRVRTSILVSSSADALLFPFSNAPAIRAIANMTIACAPNRPPRHCAAPIAHPARPA